MSSVGYVCSFAIFDFRTHGNPDVIEINEYIKNFCFFYMLKLFML